MSVDELPTMEAVTIAGPSGRLDGRLELPDARLHPAPRFLAVFGHPHPQQGGTMQSSVVVHGARALARLGGAVVRFDFRGVGKSEGQYDGGRGELDDYLAVVSMVRARWSRVTQMVAAGFSFGSIRALECAARGGATAYLGVAPPLALAKYGGELPPRVAVPAALVLAGADRLVRTSTAAELAAQFGDLRAVEIVPNADHLFFGKIKELSAAVGRAARRVVELAVD